MSKSNDIFVCFKQYKIHLLTVVNCSQHIFEFIPKQTTSPIFSQNTEVNHMLTSVQFPISFLVADQFQTL